jgi:iron complex outermembrane receptor protein
VALKTTPIAAAVAAMVFGASPVAAQTAAPAAAPAADQTVVVTGIRRAIETAIAAKKEADTIVEAITSEDLGKLPEPSVADAMARLPGVAAQRNKSSGKAQSISVRGMSPDFNTTLLNGREVASSSDSRGVDFDAYPAELLTSVLVYKTPKADLSSQGVSSTIDLRTIRPLASNQRQVAVNFRNIKTGVDNGVPNGEGKGDRMSLAYVDQFFNRTLGVAVGLTKFTETGAGQLRVNTWGGWSPWYDRSTGRLATINCDATPRPANCASVPGGFGRDIEYSDQSREAGMAVLQWKPNKNFETVVDIFQSKGRSANFKKGIEGFIGGNSDPHNYRRDPTLTNFTVANGVVTSGTLDQFKGVIRNHNEGADDKLEAFGLNAKLNLDQWTFIGDVGQSKVTRASSRYETTAGLPGNGNRTQSQGAAATPGATGTISWSNFTGSNHADLAFTSNTDFANRGTVKLTDVMGWGGGVNSPQAGYVASPKLSDEVSTLRLSAKRNLGWGAISTVEAGLNVVNRTKTASTQEGFLVINGGTGPFAAVDIPGSTTLNVAGFNIATWDPRGSLGSIYSLRSNLYGSVVNRNWSVKEDVTTGYAKADVDGKLFGFDVSGNVGVQVVNTDQKATGFVNDSGRCTGATPATCVSQSGGKSYTDVLPSLNLSVDLGNDLVTRLGIARTMSRPTMSFMRASVDQPSLPNPPLNPQRFVSSGGNPELEPYRADAFDISVEKYFGNKGYVSAAVFHKDIRNWILTLPQAYDFAGVLAAGTTPPAGGTMGILTRPTNVSGGYIQGIELAVNVPLSMFAKPLDGFGIALNHSDTKSNLRLTPQNFPGLDVGGALDIPIPGLSRRVTNLRFYYEKHGFQFAVAQRTRSDFLGMNPDYKDDVVYTFIKGESVVDLQLGYTFPDRSFLKGLSLLFQANNITDTLFQQYQTDRNSPTDTKRFGKTYLFGANYKF